jgi:hypothetical protein
MDATSGTGTVAYPSGATEFTLGFCWGSRCSIFVCCVVFCRSLFVFFLFDIVLSFIRVTDSDYPFGIFKLLPRMKPYEIILIFPL